MGGGVRGPEILTWDSPTRKLIYNLSDTSFCLLRLTNFYALLFKSDWGKIEMDKIKAGGRVVR